MNAPILSPATYKPVQELMNRVIDNCLKQGKLPSCLAGRTITTGTIRYTGKAWILPNKDSYQASVSLEITPGLTDLNKIDPFFAKLAGGVTYIKNTDTDTTKGASNYTVQERFGSAQLHTYFTPTRCNFLLLGPLSLQSNIEVYRSFFTEALDAAMQVFAVWTTTS
jgi:hypothetical protein